MKKLIFLILTLVLLVSCSSSDEIYENNDADNILGKNRTEGYITIDNISDMDNVEIWTKENEINLNDYYSLIDTIRQRSIIRSVKYYCKEDEIPIIDWNINGKSSKGREVSKIWKGDIQKWLVTNEVAIDINIASQSIRIELTINFHDTKAYRLKTIPKINITKHESDVFGFKFGDSRKNIEVTIDLNNIYSVKYDPDKNCIYFLEFSNGILSKVYYYANSKEDIVNVCSKLKIPSPTDIKIEYPYNKVSNPQEWVYGKLKLATLNLDMSTYKLYIYGCISFSKN